VEVEESEGFANLADDGAGEFVALGDVFRAVRTGVKGNLGPGTGEKAGGCFTEEEKGEVAKADGGIERALAAKGRDEGVQLKLVSEVVVHGEGGVPKAHFLKAIAEDEQVEVSQGGGGMEATVPGFEGLFADEEFAKHAVTSLNGFPSKANVVGGSVLAVGAVGMGLITGSNNQNKDAFVVGLTGQFLDQGGDGRTDLGPSIGHDLVFDLLETGSGKARKRDAGETVWISGLLGSANDVTATEVAEVVGKGGDGFEYTIHVSHLEFPLDLFAFTEGKLFELHFGFHI
jgi:hypothetical protein